MLQFEDAAKEVADEVTRPRPDGEEDVQEIQIMLRSGSNPLQVRELRVSIYLQEECGEGEIIAPPPTFSLLHASLLYFPGI